MPMPIPKSKSWKKKSPKRVLALPDLEQAKTAVLIGNGSPLVPSQLFARDASNLCNSSDAGGELDRREKAKHDVRYSIEEASTDLPVVPAGRVENHSKVFR